MNTSISAEFPFEPKFLEIKSNKMHYIDEGNGLHFIQEDHPIPLEKNWRNGKERFRKL